MPTPEKAADKVAATVPAASALPAVLPEPSAGGNYLRDPITGALTLNPAHETPQE